MIKNQLWLGALFCFIASVAWGAVFPIADIAMHQINPFWLTTFRYGSVSFLLCIILFVKEGRNAFKLERRGIKLFVLGTFGYMVNSMGLFWGQQQLGAPGVLLASIMNSLMPFFVILVVWMTTRKRPDMNTLICTILAFIGVFLVITKGDINLLVSNQIKVIPLLSIFIGVIGWVVYTVGSEPFNDWSPLRYSTLTCLFGSFMSLLMNSMMTSAGIISMPTMIEIQPAIPYLAFLIMIGGVLAILAWFKGVSMISPVNGILFINFVPITAIFISIFQGYSLSNVELIGIVLTISALIIKNVMGRRVRIITAEKLS